MAVCKQTDDIYLSLMCCPIRVLVSSAQKHISIKIGVKNSFIKRHQSIRNENVVFWHVKRNKYKKRKLFDYHDSEIGRAIAISLNFV